MYAISNKAGKFINVEYFLDPNKLFNITISAKPRLIKSKETATTAVVHLDNYLNERITHMKKIISSSEKELKSAKTSLRNANAVIIELNCMPYYQVKEQITKKQKQISDFERKVTFNESCIKDWYKTLARFEKIQKQGYELVEVKQSISCKAVTA